MTNKNSSIIYFLVILFGISSWISINSIWVELPIFVNNLPERWNLPSYFSIIIQLGNFSTLIFVIINFSLSKYFSNNKFNFQNQTSKPFFFKLEQIFILLILFLQILSGISIIFKWNNTSYLAGAERSFSLLLIVFFLALSNCSSNVLFVPYLSKFASSSYVTAYYVGAGLSGFIPSIISLTQGLGGTPKCQNITNLQNFTQFNSSVSMDKLIPEPLIPKFGIDKFFTIISIILIFSLISFIILNLKYFQKQYQNVTSAQHHSQISENQNEILISQNEHETTTQLKEFGPSNPSLLAISTTDIITNDSQTNSPDPAHERDRSVISKTSGSGLLYHRIACLIILGWISALANGIIPSIQSYATLPYGNMTFHLTVSLGSLASPLISFFAFFCPLKQLTSRCLSHKKSSFQFSDTQTRPGPNLENSAVEIDCNNSPNTFIGFYVLAIICTILSSFIIAMAIMSPTPLLVGYVGGSVLTIVIWIIIEGLFSYFKVCLAGEFHSKGKKWLLWYGIATQLGSAIGAFSIFLMINTFRLFKTGRICIP